jgi:endonuclease-3
MSATPPRKRVPKRRASKLRPDEIRELFARLSELNPKPTTELEYHSAFELLVAVILSAQATDVGVNKATRRLFPVANTPEKLLALGEDGLKRHISSIGLYNAKAGNVIAMCRQLLERHHGEVPRTREALEALPGVGRKTANVVLNTAFGEETFAVDTHVFRVCNRTGLAPGKNVDQVEAKLEKIVPQPFRRDAHHWLILHGRYTCKARLPECWRCPVIDLCRYQPKTPPPGERVKSSAARTGRRASSKARIAKGRTASKPTAGRSRVRPNRLP